MLVPTNSSGIQSSHLQNGDILKDVVARGRVVEEGWMQSTKPGLALPSSFNSVPQIAEAAGTYRGVEGLSIPTQLCSKQRGLLSPHHCICREYSKIHPVGQRGMKVASPARSTRGGSHHI